MVESFHSNVPLTRFAQLKLARSSQRDVIVGFVYAFGLPNTRVGTWKIVAMWCIHLFNPTEDTNTDGYWSLINERKNNKCTDSTERKCSGTRMEQQHYCRCRLRYGLWQSVCEFVDGIDASQFKRRSEYERFGRCVSLCLVYARTQNQPLIFCLLVLMCDGLSCNGQFILYSIFTANRIYSLGEFWKSA